MASAYNVSRLVTSPTTSNIAIANSTGATDRTLTDYHIGLITLSVLIFVSNFFVIQIYMRHVKLRRNLGNVLLLSLAISDLVAGVAILPFSIICEREFHVERKTLVAMCRFNYSLQNLCAFSTIFHIIAVTLEKYVAVLHPLKRMYIKTKGTYRKILIVVWSAALVLAFVPALWIHEESHSPTWYRRFYIYGVFQIVLFFGVSLIVLCYCYCRMFVQIHAKLSPDTQETRTQTRVRNDRKTVVVFVMFFAIFVISWLPWFVVTVLNMYTRMVGKKSIFMGMSAEAMQFLVTLRFLGAVLNPFVYALLKNDYYEALLVDVRNWCSKFAPLASRLRNSRYENQFDMTESTRAMKLAKQGPRGPRVGSFTSGASCGHSTQAEEYAADT